MLRCQMHWAHDLTPATQVLRLLVGLKKDMFDPHLTDLVPSVCALLQGSSGPTKLAAERTLARLLRVRLPPWLKDLHLQAPVCLTVPLPH